MSPAGSKNAPEAKAREKGDAAGRDHSPARPAYQFVAGGLRFGRDLVGDALRAAMRITWIPLAEGSTPRFSRGCFLQIVRHGFMPASSSLRQRPTIFTEWLSPVDGFSCSYPCGCSWCWRLGPPACTSATAHPLSRRS